MKKKEPVINIMTKTVYSVDLEKDDLYDVRDLIEKKKLRHLPVVHNGKLVGMISKSDVNRLTFSAMFEGQEDADEAVLDMLKIGQVMSHNPRVVHPDDTIRDVAEILAIEEFHALPVVKGDELVGIVTTTDVIRYMLEQY